MAITSDARGAPRARATDTLAEALDLVRALGDAAGAIREALVRGDVAQLPARAQQEQELAQRLAGHLATLQQPGGPAPRREAELVALREALRGWYRLHQQNRLLLQHAHETAAQLISVLSAQAAEPSGLYGTARGTAGSEAGGGAVAGARVVDRRV